jgi:hypothetical protein
MSPSTIAWPVGLQTCRMGCHIPLLGLHHNSSHPPNTGQVPACTLHCICNKMGHTIVSPTVKHDATPVYDIYNTATLQVVAAICANSHTPHMHCCYQTHAACAQSQGKHPVAAKNHGYMSVDELRSWICAGYRHLCSRDQRCSREAVRLTEKFGQGPGKGIK